MMQMRYFRKGDEVIGYDTEQEGLIAIILESGGIEITGNWPPPPPMPGAVTVSRFQARAALFQAGLLSDVEALMADPNTDPIARLAWTDAQDFREDSPTIQTLMPVIGITQAQLSDLFRFAKTITA